MAPCCTLPCYDQLRELVGTENYELLLDKGFVEEPTINGEGLLCKFLEFVDDNEISVADAMLIMSTLLDKGYVFSCNEGTTIIASIEEYLKYAEAVGVTQSPAVPD